MNTMFYCTELNVSPNKPFSGRMLLRVPPEVHARVSAAAQVAGISLNQWATQALTQASHA